VDKPEYAAHYFSRSYSVPSWLTGQERIRKAGNKEDREREEYQVCIFYTKFKIFSGFSVVGF
jgi:hypothetical protein